MRIPWVSKYKPSLLFIIAVIGLITIPMVSASDLSGAKDHPILKRFGGSVIVGYETKRFEAYELQTSTFKSYDFDRKRRVFAKPPLQIEGALTRIWYEAAGDTSSTELIRNYQNELKASKFEILYDSTRDSSAHWNAFLYPFSEMKLQNNRHHAIFSAAAKSGIRVSSARLRRPEGDIYVYLVAVEWSKDDKDFKAKRGAYIAVDIIETQPMVQNMVTVNADEMSKSIRDTGRVALYGIFFDSNKTEIKPDSKQALDEIAKLMKKERQLKLHVVGHTDNQGGLEFNMNLSKRRAEAVVAVLTKEYGIAPNRLTANGIAYLAPVASNATEDGRAKNRRVELVPW